MFRASFANRFEHIVFPREEKRRLAVNLGPQSLPNAFSMSFGPNWSKEEMEFVTWLLAQAGLDAAHYRAETLQRRLPACLRAVRAQSPLHAKELLEQSPTGLPAAVSALLLGVTSFFRDPLVFDQVRGEIERFKVDGKKGVNVWSIGCSEGAELYSLAMLLADLVLLEESYLLGTDCRSDAIEHARRAIYEVTTLHHVPSDLRNRYFERNESCCRVSAALRQSSRWRVASILGGCEPGLWDIILFRNTALYLRPEMVLPLWPQLESALRPGGLLVLGRAERPNGVHRLRAIGPCVYRRHPR